MSGSFHLNPNIYFFFKIRCAESESTTIMPASIAVSLITNRPPPDNNGKPNSPLPRLGTQTSGVVTKKDNVPNVMIMASPAPIKPIFGEKIPKKVKIPIAIIKMPKPRENPYVLFS